MRSVVCGEDLLIIRIWKKSYQYSSHQILATDLSTRRVLVHLKRLSLSAVTCTALPRRRAPLPAAKLIAIAAKVAADKALTGPRTPTRETL